MKYNGVADPNQLSMMKKVLQDFCSEAQIAEDSPDREHIATSIIALYESGVEDEEELARLLAAQWRDKAGL